MDEYFTFVLLLLACNTLSFACYFLAFSYIALPYGTTLFLSSQVFFFVDGGVFMVLRALLCV